MPWATDDTASSLVVMRENPEFTMTRRRSWLRSLAESWCSTLRCAWLRGARSVMSASSVVRVSVLCFFHTSWMFCAGEIRMPTRPAPISAVTACATLQQVAVGGVQLDAGDAGIH